MIQITNEAVEYLKKKGGAVSIEYPDHRTSCCGVGIPVVEVFPKRPKNTRNYHCEKVQGIDVYLSIAVELPEGPILIDVEKILFINNLTVEGFRVTDYFKD